jgi:hypothetical protein
MTLSRLRLKTWVQRSSILVFFNREFLFEMVEIVGRSISPLLKQEQTTCERVFKVLLKGALIVSFAGIFLSAILVTLECALRLTGAKPVPLASRGLSATVPDGWTQWAMRPNVSEGPEWVRTNAYGLHEDREINLASTNSKLRVAIVGSSVVWAPGHNLSNTISRAAEAVMGDKGCQVEVLNFGHQGFNLVNISSLMQVKVHQFKPDIVVLMTDLQVAYPQWPSPVPQSGAPDSVRQLSWYERSFMMASERSALLSLLNDPAKIRKIFESKLGLPIDDKNASVKSGPHLVSKHDEPVTQAAKNKPSEGHKSGGIVSTSRPASKKQVIESYEHRRKKDLGAVLSAITSFYKEMQIPLYFVTPYGPFYDSTDQELKGFSLNMLTEATVIYGTLREALFKQAELVSRIIIEKAGEGSARVINMDNLSRASFGLQNPDFSSDGIHFSAQGNRHVGKIIADRLIGDGHCRK